MTTSRRTRHTTPQVEALENIISLSGITAGHQISNGGHTSPHHVAALAPAHVGPALAPSAQQVLRPQLETPLTLSWSTMYRGDCQMHNARITFFADGSGEFSSTVLTLHTHTHDVWHIQIDVKNSAGFTLFSLPRWDGPKMSDGNPPPEYSFNVTFGYNQTFLPAIDHATAYSSC